MADCDVFNFQTGTCTEVKKGFFYNKQLTYRDSNGAVINLTTLTFVMIIKDALGGTTLLTLNEVGDNTSTGIYIPSPSTGVLNIQIAITDSDGIAVAEHFYEFTVTDSDGRLFEFFQGTIQFIDRGF